MNKISIYLLVIFLSACSTTAEISRSWVDPDIHSKGLLENLCHGIKIALDLKIKKKIKEPIKFNVVLRGGINEGDYLNLGQQPFLVVSAYGKILPDWLLDSPRISPINIHFSLLPKPLLIT